jgi:hypothetical protein
VPLATAPTVRVGSDPTWRQTELDPQTAPEKVQRGAQRLPREGVEFLYWTVTLGEEPAVTVRLLCAGPDSPVDARAGAVLIPAGQHKTTLLLDPGDGQRVLRDGDQLLRCD